VPAWQSEPKPEDPFAFPSGGDAEPTWARPAEPDHLPAEQAAFRPPTATFSEIPEDWAETPTAAPERGRAPARPIPADWGSTPTPQSPTPQSSVPQPPTPQPPPLPVAPVAMPEPKAAEPPPLPLPPREPPPEPRPAPTPPAPISAAPAATPAATAGDADLLRVMLTAAGLDPARFPAERGPEIATMFGEIARASVQGLIETLNARSVLKTEFRIERTAIQPRNNNPLKFSATATEAIGAILSPPLPAFAKGADAIAEGFRDLHEHQIGTVSGMEQALRHLLDSLAPAAVEAAAGSGGLGGMLPGGRKAKLWDAYVALHRRMTENASDNIREIFGSSFAEGYDKQKDRI
jgi:type VI secretion system FHA domain protein